MAGLLQWVPRLELVSYSQLLWGGLATSAAGWMETFAIFVIPHTLIGVLRFNFLKEDTFTNKVFAALEQKIPI